MLVGRSNHLSRSTSKAVSKTVKSEQSNPFEVASFLTHQAELDERLRMGYRWHDKGPISARRCRGIVVSDGTIELLVMD